MLNWQEVNRMVKSGLISFGSHTAEHEILDQVSIQMAGSDISRSKKDIEQRIGDSIASFAYPNGNYNNNILKVIEDSGFKSAVTTKKGFISSRTSLLEIPRVGVHEDISNTIPMFWGRIILGKF
jgi:peptidoglycan/xylan/chitin deacetylase (PgdA/CDA1 family)